MLFLIMQTNKYPGGLVGSMFHGQLQASELRQMLQAVLTSDFVTKIKLNNFWIL